MPERTRLRSTFLGNPKAGFSFGQASAVQTSERDITPPDAMSAITGAQMAPGSVTSSTLALTGNGGISLGSLVTSDTVSYNTVTYVEFQVQAKRTTLWFPFNISTKHTVNYAFYSVAIYLYKGTNAALGTFVNYPFSGFHQLPGTTPNVDTLTGIGGIDIGLSNSDAGPHVAYLKVKNDTAGTITSGATNNAFDFLGFYQFGY